MMILTLAKPEDLLRLIETVVPQSLEFARSVMVHPVVTPLPATPPPEEIETQPPTTANATAEVAEGPLTASSSPESDLKPNIYGSVSTADIATSIRTLLALNPEANEKGAAGTVSAEDVTFVTGDGTDRSAGERDRVKRTGTYEISIRVRGHSDVVKRSVSVIGEEA